MATKQIIAKISQQPVVIATTSTSDSITSTTSTSTTTVTSQTSPDSQLDATMATGGGAIYMTQLADVRIDPENMKTGALMSYNAETQTFEVLTSIESPDLKLIGGAF